MTKQNVFFMTGFPRAGSTLLMNILAQNPKFLGSPTSGLLNTVMKVRDSWKKNDLYRSMDELYIYPKIRTMLKGMITGFYKKELSENIIPIDKNRIWPGHIDLLDEIFETRVKFIYPIRHIIDCLISMERIRRKSKVNHYGSSSWINEQTTIGRASNSLKNDGFFGLPIVYLREILYRKEFDRLMLVPYDNLINNPEYTLKRLYDQLGIEYFQHDFKNITQTIIEHDLQHGYAPNSLHKIKEGELRSLNPRDMTIFDANFINRIENEKYKDITRLIKKHERVQ
jgi:sulfotransferase